MSKRINTILKYINSNDVVLDIGCDQALLGIELAKKGIISYAGDLRENIINSAVKKISALNLDKFIILKVSDGLKEFEKINKINTLVFAGLGTHTILSILNASKNKYKKIVTISNNDHYLLRKEMVKKGYKILLEEIIFEKNKYYNLIVFMIGNEKYSDKELLIGHNHKNELLLKEKNEFLINKYKKILKKISGKEKEKIENYIKLLKN